MSNLGIISAMSANKCDGKVYVHLSLGRIIDGLAEKVDKLYLCVPVNNSAPDKSRDYEIKAKNIEIIPQPFYKSSIGGLKCFSGVIRAYWKAVRASDKIFIRGMIPFIFLIYLFAKLFKTKTCHWIVGNPIALLKSHKRAGKIADTLSLIYGYQDRFFTKLGRWLTRGAMVCNGQELGKVFMSPRTFITVSSTVTPDEFYERKNTCTGNKINLIFIGFIRPEKGVEYLIEACAKLKSSFNWKLTLVGTFGKYQNYKDKIENLIAKYNLTNQIEMAGYISYGEKMFECFRNSDVFVLPTLSEGTPRVLVEARANSLPVISTTVGGIPTSITNGFDGLLVPPKDSVALAHAIERIVQDGELRRCLIANGLQTARKYTVDCFVDLVWEVIDGEDGESN